MHNAEITKKWSFDAAHRLPHHTGKCGRLHGHTYSVTVGLYGPVKKHDGASDEGMVVDYYHLGQIWKQDLEPLLDHQFLNETVAHNQWPTTSENLARWVLEQLKVRNLPVVWVSISETPNTTATVTIEDLDV